MTVFLPGFRRCLAGLVFLAVGAAHGTDAPANHSRDTVISPEVGWPVPDARGSRDAVIEGGSVYVSPILDTVKPFEPTLAANAKGDVVIAWTPMTGTTVVSYLVSRDRGLTWLPKRGAIAGTGEYMSKADPCLASDSNGGFWLSWFGARSSGLKGRTIHVALFDPTTSTFNKTLDVSSVDDSNDKPWTIADDTGTVITTWKEKGLSGLTGMFARSTDGGKTFSAPAAMGPGQMLYSCADRARGSRGPLYVVTSTFGLYKSIDGGKSWAQVYLDHQPYALIDHGCVARGNEVWWWGVPTNGVKIDSRVVVRRSSDGGRTFGKDVDVSRAAAGESVMMPAVDFGSDGHLEAIYYQGVIDGPATLVRARSKDGAAWLHSDIAPAGQFVRKGPGDYIGFQVIDDVAYAAYVEVVNKVPINLRFARWSTH